MATGAWARHGRQEIQDSHSLTAPLARWIQDPALAAVELPGVVDGGENVPPVAIPEPVLQPRPPQRLPEDLICRSPIAGLVIAVMAVAGQHVKHHEPLLIIEAMKMLNHVCPEVDGIVKAVRVAPGDAVKAGQVLFEIE